MFLTSFSVIKNTFEERFRPKTAPTSASSPTPAPSEAGSSPAGKAGFAAPPDSSEGSGTLTGEIRSDLQDAEAVMGLGEELMAAGEWARAEVFLEQAIRDRPQDKRPRHLLGVCLFRQNKISEAAKVFEDMAGTQEDPIALYNLAILYKHHLNLPERAEGLLRRALDSPDIDEDLALRLREELGASPAGR
jgi:tetratricopeptide (TPR) repeat protein